MSSRQEEKEQRRAEREQAEQAEQAAKARRQRLSMVLGGLIAVAAVAAVIVLATGGGDNGDAGDGPSASAPSGKASKEVDIPARKTEDLTAAAKAADCELRNPKNEGNDHVEAPGELEYDENPPTSGPHRPTWADDGNYASVSADGQPEIGLLVHTLEHGRINIQYAPGTPKAQVQQLETLFAENDGYHTLLFENPTGMKAAVAATAWDHAVVCPEFNDGIFDAIRAFRDRYIDQGPEVVP